MSKVSNIYLYTYADEELAKPDKELSTWGIDRCEKITDELLKMFDANKDGEIDGLEIKRALEVIIKFLERRDFDECRQMRDRVAAWLKKMREQDPNFCEEVTGDGSPFVRCEVVKTLLTDTRLEEHPGMKQLTFKLWFGAKQ